MEKRRARFPLAEWMMKILALFGIVVILFIFIFVFMEAAPVIRNSGIGLLTRTGFDRQISEAFYAPASEPALTFGLAGLAAGTLLSTLLALAAAGILGVGSAIAICEYAPGKISVILLSVVRLLASIPSVVFGLIGVMLVAPWIEDTFITVDMQIEFLEFFQMTGRNLLASALVLSFMIVPMVITLASDALSAVPAELKEVGYAFGMGHFRVITQIILPEARPGIAAGLILGAGRGIGESIAVSMVCGGIGMLPRVSHGAAALFTPILPLSAAIVNKSEAMSVPAVTSALFACGAVLLLMGAGLSLAARVFSRR
ncbi:MAG: phosphate ABC transporter permease subunit PstC [Peptococcaceae bacterium]|nr:phosphate ABC transporter permease subunit PstC [Peptococcaceae bacterium]